MRSRPSLLSLCLAPLLGACSFLIDTDSLQGGTKATASGGTGAEAGEPDASNGGHAGQAASGGSSLDAGSGGEGGNVACAPADCDDGDPCTVDTCGLDAGSGCAHAFSPGLGLEKDFAAILADTQYRVTAAAGSDAFYFSTFSQTSKKNEVEILRLGQNDDQYTSLKKLSSYPALAGGPVSVAGLAVDNSAALGESLHALVAVTALGGEPQVWELTSNAKHELGVPRKVGDSYSASSIFNYPVERALAGIVHGAWINADGTISVLSPGGGAPAAFGSPLSPASALTLVGTDANKPAVVFAGQTSGVSVQTSGHAAVPIVECQNAKGGFLSMSATPLVGHNGVWFTVWTKYAPDILTTESHALLCSNGTCIQDTSTPCKDSDSNNLQRNVATDSVHLQGDPPEQSYFVVVSPGLSVDPGAGTATAAIFASLARLGSPLEQNSSSTNIGPPLTVASQPALAPDFRGPDFPAVAILPAGSTVKVAIAWIQPTARGAASTSDELHLQRYRMCLPLR